MSIKHRWPTLDYDFRPNALSFRSLRAPSIHDIVAICDHYDEQLDLYAKMDQKYYGYVKSIIESVKNQTHALAKKEDVFNRNMEKVQGICEEFDILKAGDLKTDQPRSAKKMHDELLEVEGHYAMLIDAIESFKRQVRMLEQSIDPQKDKKLY